MAMNAAGGRRGVVRRLAPIVLPVVLAIAVMAIALAGPWLSPGLDPVAGGTGRGFLADALVIPGLLVLLALVGLAAGRGETRR